MRLFLIVRQPFCDDSEVRRQDVARLAREIRELAERRLGVEVVVDCDMGRS